MVLNECILTYILFFDLFNKIKSKQHKCNDRKLDYTSLSYPRTMRVPNSLAFVSLIGLSIWKIAADEDTGMLFFILTPFCQSYYIIFLHPVCKDICACFVYMYLLFLNQWLEAVLILIVGDS